MYNDHKKNLQSTWQTYCLLAPYTEVLFENRFIKISIFWDMTPCSYKCLITALCLHLQSNPRGLSEVGTSKLLQKLGTYTPISKASYLHEKNCYFRFIFEGVGVTGSFRCSEFSKLVLVDAVATRGHSTWFWLRQLATYGGLIRICCLRIHRPTWAQIPSGLKCKDCLPADE
jgi:hypothetical protein